MRRTLGDESTEVLKYFRERTWPILRSNAEHGYPGWTNNNVESINHVLKNVNQWRQNKLPDLIRNIKAAVSMQYADAEKAVYGEGEYLLTAELRARYCRDYDSWANLSSTQRQKIISACFQLKSACTSSVSTDRKLTVKMSTNAGKKRHQQKRPRTERTASKPKKRRCLESDEDSDCFQTPT